MVAPPPPPLVWSKSTSVNLGCVVIITWVGVVFYFCLVFRHHACTHKHDSIKCGSHHLKCDLPIAVYGALTTVTSKFHLLFPLGVHHSSHILLCPATEQTTSCRGQHSLTSEVGLETVSKRRAIKKQCLCPGSRAKCCLFPEAFLEHRVEVELYIVQGAAETGRGMHSGRMAKLIQGWGWAQFSVPDKFQCSCLCEWQPPFLLHLII